MSCMQISGQMCVPERTRFVLGNMFCVTHLMDAKMIYEFHSQNILTLICHDSNSVTEIKSKQINRQCCVKKVK